MLQLILSMIGSNTKKSKIFSEMLNHCFYLYDEGRLKENNSSISENSSGR